MFVSVRMREDSSYRLPPPDKKLFEIADDLNFPSAPSFTAFFKRETGMTPSQYRNGQSPVPED